jgi:hypothetical protein
MGQGDLLSCRVIVPSKSVKKMNLGFVFIAGRLEAIIGLNVDRTWLEQIDWEVVYQTDSRSYDSAYGIVGNPVGHTASTRGQ